MPFFLTLAPIVEKFIDDKSRLYDIDSSHNLHHSLQVKELGLVIAERDYHLNHRQREILYLSCMLHDMCDTKYTPRTQAILDISNFLTKKCYVSMLTHDAVMEIITTMSYSQIVKPDGKVEYPFWLMKEKNGWGEVFHITRESDLLTSYDLKRMIHYKHYKLGAIYSCDIYDDVMNTYSSRMSKLLDKKLFVSPSAKKIAKEWDRKLSCEISSLIEDDIYPILSAPLEPLGSFKNRIMETF